MGDAANTSTFNYADIRSKIKSTAVDWGAPGQDIDFGRGRLDAYAALRAVRPAGLTAPPPAPAHRAYQDTFTAGETSVCRYPLEVTDIRRPIAASLIVSGWNVNSPSAVDFDLQLVGPGPDGNPKALASDLSIERQNDITFRPTKPGSYALQGHTGLGRRGLRGGRLGGARLAAEHDAAHL